MSVASFNWNAQTRALPRHHAAADMYGMLHHQREARSCRARGIPPAAHAISTTSRVSSMASPARSRRARDPARTTVPEPSVPRMEIA
jgi:hypothetical protein